MSEVVEKLTKEIGEQDVPEEVSAWLGRLVLLYGIPFHYLIPEQEMLPPESIRFFYIDPIWIHDAVQGACSIGNTNYGDTLVDKAMNSLVQPNRPASSEKAASVTSKAAANVRDRLRQQFEGIVVSEETHDLAWPLTGFLLRSSVVGGWRGLEIMAYRTATDAEERDGTAKKLNDGINVVPLEALRIEQLSVDVMLGIFNGTIAKLVIRQPQESLHFGLTRQGESFSKTLRALGHKHPGLGGRVLQDNSINLEQKKLIRDQAQKGVINIAVLASEMKTQLGGSGELKDGQFTSAEFAVEMIEAAGEFTFTPNR
jgi:hypothetical protein